MWAIHQPKLEEIIGVVEARTRGVTPESALGADRWAALEARRTAHLGRQGRIHVMGLHGTIAQRVGLMTGSGGTSTDEFGRKSDAVVADRDVGGILVDADTPGGSVFGVHDWSKWNEEQGLGVTYIHAGKYKVEGHPDAPLDQEARAEMQRHVDRYYRMFVESVARNRNTTPERVEAEFGQGRIVGAADAVQRGIEVDPNRWTVIVVG